MKNVLYVTIEDRDGQLGTSSIILWNDLSPGLYSNLITAAQRKLLQPSVSITAQLAPPPSCDRPRHPRHVVWFAELHDVTPWEVPGAPPLTASERILTSSPPNGAARWLQAVRLCSQLVIGWPPPAHNQVNWTGRAGKASARLPETL